MRSEDSILPVPLFHVTTQTAEPLDQCRADLVDGWLVHAAALSAGFSTTLFPGQVLLVHGDTEETPAAFAHGVPNSSRLSTASLIQDNRMRRDLISARGIPVPKGRSFALRNGLGQALSYAETIGYPVVVKPMLNDSTTEVINAVRNPEELAEAVAYFETVPTMRPDFTAASYSITQVMTPRKAGDRRTRSSYRFMVEKHHSGVYVRLLLIEGELVSVVLAPDGPWRADLAKDLTDEVHPSAWGIARQIWDAYPGLAVMAADIVLSDWQHDWDEQDWHLVELSERPWLYLQYALSAITAKDLGRCLLEVEAKSSHSNTRSDSHDTEIAVAFSWEGVSRSKEVLDDLQRVCRALVIRGWGESQDEVSGRVGGQWEGPPEAIALLNELAVAGELLPESVVCADLSPAAVSGVRTFEIR